MNGLTIGGVARRAGVGIETVRFYERRELIDEPPRRESGYRQFPEETVLRIRFIKHAQELGFSLREIKELLALRLDAGARCLDVRERAEAKISEIDAKIRSLRTMKRALTKLTAACSGKGPATECPILEGFQKGANR